jgi:alpha-beta hydrolase superfamily lysophospholipase
MTSATGPSPAEPEPPPGGDATAAGTPERRVPGVSPALRRRLRLLFRMLSALSDGLAARLAMRLFLTPVARRIEPADEVFLATARTQRLQTPAGEVHAYEWLPPGERPPGSTPPPTVLVVHGWISHAARFAELIEALRARGLRVIACDAPAHGRSSGSQVDLLGFQAALEAVNAALGPAQGVLAHSFGALTTAHWLAQAGAPPFATAVLVGLPRDVAWLFGSFTHTLALRPATEERLRALFRERYGGDPEDFSARELARHLHMPVLLVHGGADELIPVAHASEVGELLRDGEVVVVEGLRHSAPLRDPATIERMATFLAGRLLGTKMGFLE